MYGGTIEFGPHLAQRSIVGCIMGVVAQDLPGDRERIADASESKPAYGWYGAPAPTCCDGVVGVLRDAGSRVECDGM